MPTEKYPAFIGANVTREQWEALRDLARREERLQSDIIRRWLEKEVKRQLREAEVANQDLPLLAHAESHGDAA